MVTLEQTSPAPHASPDEESAPETDAAPFLRSADENDAFFLLWPSLDPVAEWTVHVDEQFTAGEYHPEPARVIRFLQMVEPTRLLGPSHRHDEDDQYSQDVEAARSQHVAVGAVADLGEWLDLPYAEIRRIVELSTSTFYHWVNNPDVQPRRSTARSLMAVWALVGASVRALGIDDARQWWHRGNPSRLDQLTADTSAAIDKFSPVVAELSGSEDEVEPPSAPVTEEEAVARMRAMMDDA